MKDKQDLIQFRVETDLKEKFYTLAEKQGISPSKLLRSQMLKAIKEESGEIKNLTERMESQNTILLELQKFIQQMAFLIPDERTWQLYRKSNLPVYYGDTLSQHLQDCKLEGEQYWDRHWNEIDDAWFTNLKENPPLVASYLQREFMDEIREKLKE